MNGEREFNASSTEEAVEKAASSLGVSPEEVSYQVLDEGSSGFLGIGARDSRILVSPTESNVSIEPQSDNQPDALHEPEELYTERQSFPEQEELQEEPVEEQEPAPDELLSGVHEHVQELLSRTGLGGDVSVQDGEEAVHVDIDSPDSGLLIGQKGETIDSLQYLVNVSIYRDRPFQKKIVLDAGGYRERRVKAVQGMALRAAKRVSKDGKAVELPSMSSSERRAVHNYLKDDPRVTTSSDGKDEDRKITILPA